MMRIHRLVLKQYLNQCKRDLMYLCLNACDLNIIKTCLFVGDHGDAEEESDTECPHEKGYIPNTLNSSNTPISIPIV